MYDLGAPPPPAKTTLQQLFDAFVEQHRLRVREKEIIEEYGVSHDDVHGSYASIRKARDNPNRLSDGIRQMMVRFLTERIDEERTIMEAGREEIRAVRVQLKVVKERIAVLMRQNTEEQAEMYLKEKWMSTR